MWSLKNICVNILTTYRVGTMYRPSSLVRGRIHEAILRRSEAGVPAAALATQAREVRNPPAGHYDPCREELAASPPEAMLGEEARTRTRKSPGGAPRGERPDRKGRAAPHQRGSKVRRSALRRPSLRGGQRKVSKPGRGTAAGTKKRAGGLFEIVNRNGAATRVRSALRAGRIAPSRSSQQFVGPWIFSAKRTEANPTKLRRLTPLFSPAPRTRASRRRRRCRGRPAWLAPPPGSLAPCGRRRG
jgi:hypothetical protein